MVLKLNFQLVIFSFQVMLCASLFAIVRKLIHSGWWRWVSLLGQNALKIKKKCTYLGVYSCLEYVIIFKKRIVCHATIHTRMVAGRKVFSFIKSLANLLVVLIHKLVNFSWLKIVWVLDTYRLQFKLIIYMSVW